MIDHLFLAGMGIYTVWTGSKYFPIRNKQAAFSMITQNANIVANAATKFIEDNSGHQVMGIEDNLGKTFQQSVDSIKSRSFSVFIKSTIDNTPNKHLAFEKISERFNTVANMIGEFPSFDAKMKGYAELAETLSTSQKKMDWNAFYAIKGFSGIDDPNPYSYKFMASTILTVIDAGAIASGYTPIDSFLVSDSTSNSTELSGLDNAGKEDI